MKKLPVGFASPIILIAVGLIVGIGITFAYFQFKSKPAPQSQPANTQNTIQSSPTSKVSPTTLVDEMANWKTYTNSKVGFKVKYPKRYPEAQLPRGLATNPEIYTTGEEVNANVIFGLKTGDSYILTIFPHNGELDDLLNTPNAKGLPPYQWEDAEGVSTEIIGYEVDGEQALWVNAMPKNSPNDTFVAVFLKADDYGLILHSKFNPYAPSTNPKHDPEEMRKILSTFKFINQ